MYGGVMINDKDNVTFIALILTYAAPLFERRTLNRRSRLCTGSILSPDWVITAAHCVVRNNGEKPVPKLTQISLGFKRAYRTRANMIYIHPNYTHKGGADIAMLLTQDRIPLGREDTGLTALGLPLMKFSGSPKSCYIYGYGEKNRYDSLTTVSLSRIRITPLKANECPKLFVYHMEPICYIAHNGIGPCMGDSGGPLICSNEILTGVLSRGLFHTVCGMGHPLILYEDIYVFRTWILRKLLSTETLSRNYLARSVSVSNLSQNCIVNVLVVIIISIIEM